MTRWKRRKSEQGGFTLIEIMIAMVVMIIGLAGVLMMQTAAVKANRASGRFTRSAQLAQEKMEELRGIPVAQLEATESTVEITQITNVQYRVSYAIEEIIGQPNLVMLTVTVQYAEEGDEDESHFAQVQMIRTRPEAL